jgi:5,10-methylenetetrahydrofolate reductase
MNLKAKIQDPAQPVVFYELIPPKAGASAEMETLLELVHGLRGKVDAINIPEIYEESRQGTRGTRLPERVEPRAFAQAIHKAAGMETVVNRVTVVETAERQRRWLRETHEEFGVRNLILVGGESGAKEYPGPSVLRMAETASELGFFLGGITIPSRSREAARIRRKYEHGLRFFTTQVLFDPNDTVDLLQSLNGLDVRLLLSFAPISNLRDIEFLQWLGVDVPRNIAWAVEQAGEPAKAAERTIALASRILTDIFHDLPAHPPALGINVEQITRRTYGAAQQMLAELSAVYPPYIRARAAHEHGR